MAKPKKDYEVGYGKPPKHGQFKKGQSGNAKGRPKGARALKRDLKDELDEMVTIVENGQETTLSKQRLLLKQLMSKGAKGDIRAIQKLFELTISLVDREEDQNAFKRDLTAEDQALLRAWTENKLKGSNDAQ